MKVILEFETHRKPEEVLNTAAHLDGILIAMRNLFDHIEAPLESVPIDERSKLFDSAAKRVADEFEKRKTSVPNASGKSQRRAARPKTTP